MTVPVKVRKTQAQIQTNTVVNQRLTHFLKFLEILKILKNIYLKITEDLKSRIHIFLIIRRRNRNIETDQIALSDSSLVLRVIMEFLILVLIEISEVQFF